MLVICLVVFAVLVQNGDSNCIQDLQDSIQVCQNQLQDAIQEASKMSDTDARNQKACCALDGFENCLTNAGKKCGDSAEQMVKNAFQVAKSVMPETPCSDYPCSGASSIVPMNTVVVYLLLSLGYVLYQNIF